jgi:hypothetical protein
VCHGSVFPLHSLLGKVLPTTLAASDADGGGQVKVTFERVIVHPNGHREIEGVTPKLLPPSSHMLPKQDGVEIDVKEIKDLDALECAPIGVITTPGTKNPKYVPTEPSPPASSLGEF